MTITIEIPDHLDHERAKNVFEALEIIQSNLNWKEEPISIKQDSVVVEEVVDIQKQERPKKDSCLKDKEGLPKMTRVEKERDERITKVIKSMKGAKSSKTRIARTAYKNLTKIYGIVWLQEEKDFKEKWNVDEDVKVSKRRCVIADTRLYDLYINHLRSIVSHYNDVTSNGEF